MRLRISATLAVLAITAIGAGCGSSNDNTSSTSASAAKTATPGINVPVDPTIAAAVPADIKSGGTVTVAADATYAPDEFIAPDGKTVIGADADLAKAIGQVMGLKAEVQDAPFDSIIPGIDAGKYNLGMSSFTDTKEREKVVDFVTYLTAGTSFFVSADNGPDIASLDALCGHSVAVEKGTTQQEDATAQNEKCTKAGNGGVDVQVYPDQTEVNLTVVSGRAEVGMADSPVADYAVVQSDGKLKLTGGSYANEPYGIAMAKDSGMQQPVLDAVKAIMADGTYDKILEYWGLKDGAIDNPVIDGAVS